MTSLETGDAAAARGSDRPPAATTTAAYDLLCLSHLRWDFVYQRPQHLLSRCARSRRVFFVEEPHATEGPPRLDFGRGGGGVTVAVPYLPHGLGDEAREQILQEMLDDLIVGHDLRSYVLWYYTPMSLGFSRHLRPAATVYDCMDELSAFLGAPALLRERERELLRTADLVFAGGRSLCTAKRALRPATHLFPSSIDAAHFAQARAQRGDPADQADIPRPRLGYFGVIDERIDLELLAGIADLRPDFNIVMVGPVAKIDPEALPRRANIHYLGQKAYAELPAYIGGWDVAIMPFSRNEATRFISPTKTPEYLAAGRPVVATSIRDVVDPYGAQGLVAIADTPAEFVAAADRALREAGRAAWLGRVDAFLAGTSWDRTWSSMEALISAAVRANEAASARQEVAGCSTT